MTAAAVQTMEMDSVDLNECWALDQRCFADSEAYDRNTFQHLLTSRNAIALKSVIQGHRMVAFAIGLLENDGTGHVVVIGVAPEWRRQGIARELMWTLEDAFRRCGVTLTHLEVRTTNHGARELYEKLGYSVAGRRLGYYTNGDDGFLMIKNL